MVAPTGPMHMSSLFMSVYISQKKSAVNYYNGFCANSMMDALLHRQIYLAFVYSICVPHTCRFCTLHADCREVDGILTQA